MRESRRVFKIGHQRRCRVPNEKGGFVERSKEKNSFFFLFRVSSSSIFFSLIVKKMVGEKNKIKIKYRKRESNKKDDDSDFKR